MITTRMRDLLIEHIDGPVPIIRNTVRPNRFLIVRGAVELGLLRYDEARCARPKRTVITEKGRELLAEALADWADAITKARAWRADHSGR